MRFLSTPFLRSIFLSLLPLAFSTACQRTVVWTPASTMSTVRERTASTPESTSTKEFVMKSDWQDGDWVMKKGARIAFRADGSGSFSGRLFTIRSAENQEFRFQSAQYGRDAHLLFTAPGADLGHAILARRASRDYPVDFNFGYDSRQYEFIERALFTARIRKPAESTRLTTMSDLGK